MARQNVPARAGIATYVLTRGGMLAGLVALGLAWLLLIVLAAIWTPVYLLIGVWQMWPFNRKRKIEAIAAELQAAVAEEITPSQLVSGGNRLPDWAKAIIRILIVRFAPVGAINVVLDALAAIAGMMPDGDAKKHVLALIEQLRSVLSGFHAMQAARKLALMESGE